MDQDKISVIVPVYNTAPYLDRCIGSILAQTYGNLEVLLINDGSSDNSGELCDAFAREDRRVKVIHQRNRGVSAARNRGIDAATGKWLAFVDSDDIISENMIMTLYKIAGCYGAEISTCGLMLLADQTGISSGEDSPKVGTFTRKEAMRDFITTRGFGGFLCNKLFRADLLQKPEPLRLCTDIFTCEDMLITCQLTERATVIAYTSQKLYGYVERSNSATKTITEKTLSSLAARKRLIELYDRNGLPDAKSWYVYGLSNLLTFRNTAAVQAHYRELLADFQANRWNFVSECHSMKEKILFYSLAVCPRLFSWVYSSLRKIRSELWKRKC